MKIRAPFSIFGGRGYLRLITVDVIIVEAAGTGNTSSGKVTESLTADALVPVLMVGFANTAGASLEGFVVSGSDFCFSLAGSSLAVGRVLLACP